MIREKTMPVQSEIRPRWGGDILTMGFAITVAVVGRLTEPMRSLLPWWSIVVANGAATVCAAAYLLKTRPGLWRRMFG